MCPYNKETWAVSELGKAALWKWFYWDLKDVESNQVKRKGLGILRGIPRVSLLLLPTL